MSDKEIMEEAVGYLTYHGARRISLFGSYVKGETNAGNDCGPGSRLVKSSYT